MKNYLTLVFVLFFSLNGYSSRKPLQAKELKTVEILAGQIEASLENNNPGYFNSLIHVESILNKIIFKETNNYEIIQFNTGFKIGFSENLDLGSLIVSEIDYNGSYKYLSSYQSDNKIRILFRLFNDEGLNYHELEISEVEGEKRITDIYVYLTGEFISQTLHRMYQEQLAANCLYSNQYHSSKTANLILKSEKYFTAGKYEKAMTNWNKIEEKDKFSKNVLLRGISYASYASVDNMDELINQFNRHYKNDPGYLLSSVIGLINTGENKKALVVIDKLDKYVQHDPILDLIRGRICLEMNNTSASKTYYSRIIDQMPDFEMGYFALLDLYIQYDEFQNATDILDRMTYRFNAFKADFDIILKDYPVFLNSSEYLSWLSE